MNTKLSDGAKVAIDKVVNKFKSGDLGPLIDVIRLRWAEGDMPSLAWSLSNQVLAYMQSGGELDCRGFRQWEGAKRNVKKGAKAVYILGPIIKKDKDDPEKMHLLGFRTIAVFPLSQTEGEPLGETFGYAPTEFPPLMDVAERLGIVVDYGPIGNALGWYARGSKKRIQLGTHDWGTFFHELAHAAHDSIEPLKGGQDVEQETIAEFTAAVLMGMYGKDYTGNAWQYISAYAPNDPIKAIVRALAKVEKVLEVILPQEVIA